jgi:predicted membrane GTPase involved in stress response
VIRDRLFRELDKNVALRVKGNNNNDGDEMMMIFAYVIVLLDSLSSSPTTLSLSSPAILLETDSSDTYEVCGRGQLHLTVLIENMRREGRMRG